MRRSILLILTLAALAHTGMAQDNSSRINRSLFTGTTVDMTVVNDTTKYYAFGKPDNIIVSGDYDYINSMLTRMKNFSRDCSWGDKEHITEHLSIERRGLTGPRAYRIVNDSIGTQIRTGFNSISECWHAVWVNRPANADSIALVRRKARQAAEAEQNGGFPFDGPFGGFGGGFGGFGGFDGPPF